MWMHNWMVVWCTVEVSMSRQRAIIQIPQQLAAELDELAGSGHRSQFAVEVLQREVQRKRLIKLFESKEPIWKDEDHPELENGADQWVRQMRRESETRLPRLDID